MPLTALNRSQVLLLTNKSGGSVAQGDVVVVDTANAAAFITTTTGAYGTGPIGVVIEPNGIADAALGLVAFTGYVPKLNLSGSASLADLFKTHTVAKQAVRHAAPMVQGDFGIVLGTGTTPAAMLFGSVFPGTTAGGAMTQIAQTILSGTATNFNFAGIPGTYNHLKLILMGRGDNAATSSAVHLSFNGDGAGNYDSNTLDIVNTTVGGSSSNASANNFVGGVPAANATANQAGIIEITIPAYALTTFYKNYMAIGGHAETQVASGQVQRYTEGQWRNTAAINRVTLTISAGNFIIGSMCTLYGLT